MLRRIRIQNHALIEQVELHLGEGFHVFTGETGSGKSILLGAVGLLLGDRGDSSGVGLHGDRAIIEGDFSALQLQGWLENEELPVGACVTVRREVLRNGRSRVFINDAQASVGQLKDLGERMVDMHRQDHSGDFLQRPVLCDLLDRSGNHDDIHAAYRQAYTSWFRAKAELDRLKALLNTPKGDADYLQHQVQELRSMQLQSLDWSEFSAELKRLQHATELHEGIREAWSGCDSESEGALTALTRARKALSTLEGVDLEVDDVIQRLNSVRIEVQDLASTLENLLETTQPDPHRLNQLEERFDAIQRACRKHNVDEPADLIRIEENLADQIRAIHGFSDDLDAAIGNEEQARLSMELAGASLTNARQRAAKGLTDTVVPLLARLKMPHATMKWDWPPCTPDEFGIECPEVWFSSNPGSPLLPLGKVASGGERARFMLALKSVLAEIQSTPVVILDEIDTGVSGEVAAHMGRAMSQIAQSSQTQQVLAVTHLPQVAALATNHWEVSKTTDGATTHVTVHALDGQARQRAIASMLSGADVTEEALGQAARLLESK